jgi:signal peptidase I
MDVMSEENQIHTLDKSRYYRGRSMRGTFRQGDLLTVAPARVEYLRPGDIIVFFRQDNDDRKIVVHRTLRRLPEGLVTCGDAAAHEDVGVVTEHNLVGRVCFKNRNGRTSTVHGGWIGLCQGCWLHFYWRTRRQTVRAIQKPYAVLRASGIIPRLWKPEIFRVRVNSEYGPCIQHIWKNRIIARFWLEERRFECKKPWDLFIHPDMANKFLQ